MSGEGLFESIDSQISLGYLLRENTQWRLHSEGQSQMSPLLGGHDREHYV